MKAMAQRKRPRSLLPEAYALQELLQLSADCAVSELGRRRVSARAARFLSPQIDEPRISSVAEQLHLCREHVSRLFRPLAFGTVATAFRRLGEGGKPDAIGAMDSQKAAILLRE